MPNAVTNVPELMFEEFVEAYDAGCVLSVEATKTSPEAVALQRAGDTFYVRQNYHTSVVTGLDISASADTDVIERFVPTTFRSPDNVRFTLDAKEMRDPVHMREMGKSAGLRLAAEIDKNLQTEIGLRANMVIKKVGAFTWDDAATADALMISRGINSERKLFLNPFDHLAVAKDLGNRAYLGDMSKSAYERSMIPDIAGFQSFRMDQQYNLATAGTVTGLTISGATSHTVTAMTGATPTDNRQMTVTVAGANLANTKNGDTFTLANSGTPINAVHMMDKSDTGQAMTFRIISGGGTSTLVISPPIISSGPYQNVTAAAANGATLTFQNNATKPINPFFSKGAVCLDYGRLEFPSDQGPKVMTANTKNGVPLVMMYGFNHLTGKTTVRATTFYAATVRDPEKVGFIIANQT